MQMFNKAVTEEVKTQFVDVQERLAPPLYEYLRKHRAKCYGTAIRLMVLGQDEQTAKPWLVVLCPRSTEKHITRFFRSRFFRKDLAKRLCKGSEPGQIDFEWVIDGRSTNFTSGEEPVLVLGEERCCNTEGWWAPHVKTARMDTSRIATLGGYVYVYDQSQEKTIYGLTCGHLFLGCHHDDNDKDLSSGDDDDDSSSSDTTDNDVQGAEGDFRNDNICYGANSDTENLRWASLGTVAPCTFSDRARNRDWALIDLTEMHSGRYELPQPTSAYHYRAAQPVEGPAVLVCHNSSFEVEISDLPAMLLLPSGQAFVRVYTLVLSNHSGRVHL
jgi:hypothetical protein